MGGTSFKAGVMRSGRFDYSREPSVVRYHYAVPKMDIVSIGAGGGSIISVEGLDKTPRVGPKSAGAYPGPICYGHGGIEPTLTDVDLILGYLQPDRFFTGRKKLDHEKALAVFNQKVAEPLGMDALEAASQIYNLANSILYDLLHKITVERGTDPRNSTLVAYGGQAGLHACAYGPKLGVSKVTGYRLRATATLPKPQIREFDAGGSDPSAALLGNKEIYLEGKGSVKANLYDYERFAPGNKIIGPAIVITPITTVLLFPDQQATCDKYRNIVITW